MLLMKINCINQFAMTRNNKSFSSCKNRVRLFSDVMKQGRIIVISKINIDHKCYTRYGSLQGICLTIMIFLVKRVPPPSHLFLTSLNLNILQDMKESFDKIFHIKAFNNFLKNSKSLNQKSKATV